MIPPVPTNDPVPGRWRILLLCSVPIAAPWNGSDKNIAAILARADSANDYLVHTDHQEDWSGASHVVPLRQWRARTMPDRRQRLAGLAVSARHGRNCEAIHVVASIRDPRRLDNALARRFLTSLGHPIVHSCPSLGDGRLEPQDLFASATVVFSSHSRRILEGLGARNVFLVDPPIDLQRLRPQRSEAHHRRALGARGRLILYPGHYGPASGMREAVMALSRLAPDLSDTVLVIAPRHHPNVNPKRSSRELLEFAAQMGVLDRIRIIAPVTDMAGLIEACSVLAYVPTRLAGTMDLPMVLLEAQALGRMVVGPDVAPASEAVMAGGLRVPPGRADALAEALTRALRGASMGPGLLQGVREEVRRRCDPRRFAAAYAGVYAAAEYGWDATAERGSPEAVRASS